MSRLATANRCKAPISTGDLRCSNAAYVLGLCKTHLRRRGVVKVCEHCHGLGMRLVKFPKRTKP